MSRKRLRLLLATLFVFGLVLAGFDSGSVPGAVKAEAFANPAFSKLWNVTDKPVSDGITSRSYLWGPAPFATQVERYDNSPKRSRVVQYFDKGRMELTNPDGDPESAWYVGSGLLVRDLAAGLVQVGDNTVQVYEPAQIPVAGDPDPLVNKAAPTYADFGRELLGQGTGSKTGSIIRATFKAGGFPGTRAAKAEPEVKYAFYVPQTGHNIAAPFWDYFQQRGPLYTPKGATVTGTLFDWQYLMGYPLSEPYWIKITLDGKETEALVQLFERRVLTYTPSNPEGFQVEMGNVGQHYYRWRYGPPPTIEPQETGLPDSTGGTVTPKIGGKNTRFRLYSDGYQPYERLYITLVFPGSKAYPTETRADGKGVFDLTLPASYLVSPSGEGYGLYIIGLKGQSSGKTANLYFRIIKTAPRTPTTPYSLDKSVPPSVNAIPVPAAGPLGTNFITQVRGFYEKDFALNRVAIWTTDPYGTVMASGRLPGEVILNETLEGAVLILGSPPEPGVWAITIQDRNNPAKQSITYIRVTEAPPEVTLGAAINILVPHGNPGLFQLDPQLPFELDFLTPPTESQE